MKVGALILRLQGEVAKRDWDSARATALAIAQECRMRELDGIQKPQTQQQLVSAAAEAQKKFGDDELERYAEELEQKRKEEQCPRHEMKGNE